MQLENSFSVPLPVDEAWRVLLDIERIAPCMPGAVLDSVDGGHFTGSIKVKLGPINLTYQGKASITDRDETAHRVVIDARGKDQRGNGTAVAAMTVTLVSEQGATRVDVVSDLTITGRPAQFGRGVMTDVGNKMLGQFADKLAARLGAEPAAAAISSPGQVAKAAGTAAGAVEEIAASVEQVPGDGAAAKTVKKVAAATKKTAAAATEKVREQVTQPAPVKKATPAKAVPPKKAEPKKSEPKKSEPKAASAPKAAPATKDAPARAAAVDVVPASGGARRPSGPPTGPSAPPARPATGAPLRSVPPAGARPAAPAAPVGQPARPAPIDLLEISGASAPGRYAPVVAAAAVVLAVVVLVRRRRRNR